MAEPNLGRKIAELRKRAGLTQVQVGAQSGFSSQYISRVEGGKVRPSWRFLVALANVLQCPVTEVLREAGYLEAPGERDAELVAALAGSPQLAELVALLCAEPRLVAEVLGHARGHRDSAGTALGQAASTAGAGERPAPTTNTLLLADGGGARGVIAPGAAVAHCAAGIAGTRTDGPTAHSGCG